MSSSCTRKVGPYERRIGDNPYCRLHMAKMAEKSDQRVRWNRRRSRRLAVGGLVLASSVLLIAARLVLSGRRRPLLAVVLGWLFERLYHEFAGSYDLVSWLVSGGRWRAWQMAAMPLLTGRRILEVGSGPGHLLAQLLSDGYDAIGLDRSDAMQRQARSRLIRSGLPASIVGGDARTLPFPSATFDTVVLTFPAPFVRDVAFWNETARVLRPSGRVVVVEAATSNTVAWPGLVERALATLLGGVTQPPPDVSCGPLGGRRLQITNQFGTIWAVVAEKSGGGQEKSALTDSSK